MEPYEQTEYSDSAISVLPPGFERLENMVYGYVYVKIGKLLWLKTGGSYSMANSKIKMKFWGEKGNGKFLRCSNAGNEVSRFPTEVKYEVRCSLGHFQKYLQDMAKLKLHVLDSRNDKALGTVTINLLFFLKKSKLADDEVSPIENLSGSFPIMKLSKASDAGNEQGEKIGDLEVEVQALFAKPKKVQQPTMPANTNATRARSADSPSKHLNSSFMMNEIKAQQANVSPNQKGGLIPSDLYADAQPKPQPYYERDNRIPRSLVPQPEDQAYRPEAFSGAKSQYPSQYNTNANLQTTASFSGAAGADNRGTAYMRPSHSEDKPSPVKLESYKIDDILQRTKELEKRMLNSERERIEPPPRTNPSALFSVTNPVRSRPYMDSIFPRGPILEDFPNVDFDGTETGKLDQSVELERAKLMIDEAALMDNRAERGRSGSPERGKKEARNAEGKSEITFNDIDGLKLNIIEFECDNETLKTRLKSEKVALEVSLPVAAGASQEGEEALFDTSRFFAKKNIDNVWYFNNELAQALNLQEGDFKALINAGVKFKLQLNTINPRTNDTITMILAEGEFSLEKVVLSPGYFGSFMVPLKTRIPLNAGKSAEKKAPKKATKQPIVKTTKSSSELNLLETESIAGNLTINCRLTSSKHEDTRVIGGRKEETAKTVAPQQHSYLPLQMMLYIERIPKIIERTQLDFPFRNIYVSYKIYGTNETIRSDIRWKTNAPYLDHQMVFPLSPEAIMKMDTVPFVIEVWDKFEGGRDQLLGLVKLNLARVKQALYDAQSGEVNMSYLSTSAYPLMVYDEGLPIRDVKNTVENGIMQTILAVGTPAQLNKFETRLKEKRSSYAEVKERRPYEPSPIKSPIKSPASKKDLVLEQELPKEEEENEEESSEIISEKPKPSPKATKKRNVLEELETEDDFSSPAVTNFEAVVSILERFRVRKGFNDPTFKQFISQSEAVYSNEDIATLLLDLKYGFRPRYIKKFIETLDYPNSGFISREYLLGSLKAYFQVEEHLRDQVNKNAKVLDTAIKQNDISIASLEAVLRSKSKGYLSTTQQTVQDVFEQRGIRIPEGTLDFIFHMLDHNQTGTVFIPDFIDLLKALDLNGNLEFLSARPWFFAQNVADTIKRMLKNKKELTRSELEHAIQETLHDETDVTLDGAIELFIRLGVQLSFFEVLCVFEAIKREYQIVDRNERLASVLSLKALNSWLKDAVEHKEGGRQNVLDDLRASVDSDGITELARALNSPKREEERQRHDDIPERPEEHSERSGYRPRSPQGGKQDQRIIQELREQLERNRREELEARKKQEELLASLTQQLHGTRPESPARNIQPQQKQEEKKIEERKVEEKKIEEPISESKFGDRKLFNRRLYKHSIKIDVHQVGNLNLPSSLNTSKLLLRYLVPNTDEQVESNEFRYFSNERNYTVAMSSSHSWVLPVGENLVDQLQSSVNGLLIELCYVDGITKEVVGYTVVPLEEIHELINKVNDSPKGAENFSEMSKIYLLYRHGSYSTKRTIEDQSPVVGKIYFDLRYEREHPLNDQYITEDIYHKRGLREEEGNRQVLLEREYSIQRMLPKNGFLHVSFDSLQSIRKGIDYLKRESNDVAKALEGFDASSSRIKVKLEIFKQDEELSNTIKPIELSLEYYKLSQTEIALDHQVSVPLQMSNEILEYIQNKFAYLSIELEIPRDTAAYLVGEAQISLLPLLTSQTGVAGEFALNNSQGYYSGSVELNINFNKEQRMARKTDAIRKELKDNSVYKLFIAFNEIVNFGELNEADPGEGILFLNMSYGSESLRSLFYNVNKRSHLIDMEDNYFFIDVDRTSELLNRQLEIQLVEKTKPKYIDKVLGVTTIDLTELFKGALQNKSYHTDSFYVSFCDPDNAKVLRKRLGVKLIVLKSDDKTKLDRISKHLKEIVQSEKATGLAATLLRKADKTRSVKLQEAQSTLQSTAKLRLHEIDELTSFFSQDRGEVPIDVFLRGDYHPELISGRIDEAQTRQLFMEFAYYDSESDGFIEESAAKLIQGVIRDQIPITEDEIKHFIIQEHKGVNYLDTRKKIGKFDYLIFLRRLCDHTIRSLKLDSSRIPSDTRRLQDHFATKMSFGAHTQNYRSSPLRSLAYTRQPAVLKLSVLSGTNFKALNGGVPPTSIVRCERAESRGDDAKRVIFETQTAYRSDNPDFSEVTKEIKLENLMQEIRDNYPYLEFNVYHKSYNQNYLEEMQRYELIASATLPLERYVQSDGSINIEENLILQPRKTQASMTQSNTYLKVRITSTVAEESYPQPQPQHHQASFGSYPRREIREPVIEELQDVPDYEHDGDFKKETIENFLKTLEEVRNSPIFQRARESVHEDELMDMGIQGRLNFEAEGLGRSGEKFDIKTISQNIENISKAINTWNRVPLDGGSTLQQTGDNPFLKNLHHTENRFKDRGFDPNVRPVPDFVPTETLKDTSRFANGLREEIKQSEKENTAVNPQQNESPSSKDVTEKTSSNQTGGSKPPLGTNSSTSSVRRIEKKYAGFKDKEELSRIERIMKADYSSSKKLYEDSSDDD